MATIQITVTRTGQTIPTKTSSPSDADLDSLVAAYQADANSSLSTPGNAVVATYAQVLNYIITQWFNSAKQRVQQVNTTPAVIPSPIGLN